MNKGYFITAIGTDCGKTLVSSIFTEALKADYWKPVQAGEPRDSKEVQRLISNPVTKIWPEKYILNTPASPHAAAKIDGIEIRLDDFKLPESKKMVIVEGAGGILVPLNDSETIGSLINHLKLPVVLVSNLYLGSINHTLLSAFYLMKQQVKVEGIIFNGEPNPESERIIQKTTGWPVLLRIKPEKVLNSELVKKYANQLLDNWDHNSTN